MSSERAAGSEISSRRFACDRCRGQKLRCLREGADPERCDRCVRANAKCITSPLFRMRRPRVDASNSESGQRRRQYPRVQRHPHGGPPIRTPTSEEGGPTASRRISQASIDEVNLSTLLTQRHPSNASAESGTLTNLPWLESRQDWRAQCPTTTTMCVDSTEPRPTSDSLNNSNFALPWGRNDDSVMYDLMFTDGLDTSFMNFGGHKDSEEKSEHQESVSILTPASPPITVHSSKSALSPLTMPDVQGTEANSKAHRRHGSTDLDISGPGSGRELEDNSAPNQDIDVPKGGHKIGGKESYIQRLSSLSFNLSTQLSLIDAGPPTVTLDSLISPSAGGRNSKATPVDNILNDTREYLDILTLLTTSSQASAISPSADACSTASTHHKRDRRRTGCSNHTDRSTSTSSSSAYSSLDSLPTSPTSITSTNHRRSEPGHDAHLDTAALLLLTTCYVHIIRLYVVLFTHVQIFLTEIASSDDPYLCPIPELSFSAFSIQSGNLQAMILIQIVTHLLEKIERLLGFPQEFRLNASGGDYQGLLSNEDFAKIVKIVINKEKIGRPENGKGGIKALRKNIKKSKHLLKESIAP